MQQLKKILFSRMQRLLAIEVSEYAIKILVLAKIKEKITITKFAHVLIERTVEDALKDALQTLNLKQFSIVVAIPYIEALISKFTLPDNLSISEIIKYCKFALAKQLKVSQEQVYFDFHKVNESSHNQGQRTINCFAVSAATFAQFLQPLHNCNLIAAVVDLDALAIERCVRWQKQKIQGNFAVINFNSKGFLLIVLNASQLCYARMVEVACLDSCSVDEVGMQVATTLKAYQASAQIFWQKILICGDGDRLGFLVAHLKSSRQLDVEIFNPLEGFDLENESTTHQFISITQSFAVCCGLALRQFIHDRN